MLKTSIVAIIFFVMGFSASHLYKNTPDEINEPLSAIEIPLQKQNSIPPKNVSTGVVKTSTQSTSSAPRVIKFDEPKTSFGYYQAFASLDNFSADEIANYLLSIDPNKTEMRRQIAWYLSGKFPEKVFFLLNSNLITSDLELSKILIFNVSSNHPDITMAWIEDNQDILDAVFQNSTEGYQLQLNTLKGLAMLPEHKWDAYEKGRKLIQNGPRGQDKYAMLTLAQLTASSNPQEAINYALSSEDGKIDASLLNGALNELAKVDPDAAAIHILENQQLIDPSSVTATTTALVFKDKSDNAFRLINALKSDELKNRAISGLASNIVTQGKNETDALKLVQTMADDTSKIEAARAVITTMSVVGYSVERQLDILNQGLTTVSNSSKSFQYAWVLHNAYGNNSSEINNQIIQLERNNAELAKAVQTTLEHFE